MTRGKAYGKIWRMPPGFTLLEVLVALVVLGLILAGLAQGTQFGLRVTRRQTQVIADAGDMDAAERLLRRLIEQMNPGTTTHAPFLAGGPGSLGFTANLAAAAPALGVAEADVSLGVTADHRLVLRWTPHLHATPLGPPPPVQEATLLPGVLRAEFAYWSSSGTWLATWPEQTLPELVRITLVFQPELGRHWPAIIAEPMRKRLNG
jgi:general secretion pathway protein J